MEQAAGCCCSPSPTTCPDGECITGDKITDVCGMPQGSGDSFTLFCTPDRGQVSLLAGCETPDYISRDLIKVKYDWVRCEQIWLLRSQSLNGDRMFPACITEPPSGGGVFTDIVDAWTCWQKGGCADINPDVSLYVPTGTCIPQSTVGLEATGFRGASQYYNTNFTGDLVDDQYCCVLNVSLVPTDCWTKGLTRYQRLAAEENYLWAHEIFNFAEADDLNMLGGWLDENGAYSTTAHPLWKDFLGFTFKEHYYRCNTDCVDLTGVFPLNPAWAPGESLMGKTNPDLYRVLPKYLVSGCSGVPVFQYQLRELQVAGHIADWQAVVVSWRKLEQMYTATDPSDPFTQEDVVRVRAAIAMLIEHGDGGAKDWRGTLYDMMSTPCVDSPADVGESQREFGVALRRHKAFDGRPAVATAADLQPVACVLDTLVGQDSKGTIMFRAMPGGMSFAHWAIDSPPTHSHLDPGPWNNWWDRMVAPAYLRVIGHSEIYETNGPDFAWNPRGDPRELDGGGWSPYPGPHACPAAICDTWGHSPQVELWGHAAYRAGRYSMVAIHAEYAYPLAEPQTCRAPIVNLAYARAPNRQSVWDITTVPYVSRIRVAGDDDDGRETVDPSRGHHAPCHACQSLSSEYIDPPIDPDIALAMSGECERRTFDDTQPHVDFVGGSSNNETFDVGPDADCNCG